LQARSSLNDRIDECFSYEDEIESFIEFYFCCNCEIYSSLSCVELSRQNEEFIVKFKLRKQVNDINNQLHHNKLVIFYIFLWIFWWLHLQDSRKKLKFIPFSMKTNERFQCPYKVQMFTTKNSSQNQNPLKNRLKSIFLVNWFIDLTFNLNFHNFKTLFGNCKKIEFSAMQRDMKETLMYVC
jgi:hypothetical protein